MDPFPELERAGPKFTDGRGWLQVLYEGESTVLKRSFSNKGVFRGLHAQMAPSPQHKLIRVVEGSIIDIVVDLNDPARTIRHRRVVPGDGWIHIAANYAHGFYAEVDTIFEYVCDGAYDEASEQAFSIVDWLARELGVIDPILSEKDRRAAPLQPVV